MRRNVKELLVQAKDASELMVDLAYATVFFNDEDLGREVLGLEQQMDTAVHEMRLLCMIASRSPEDASQMAGLLGMVNAMEGIADAAEDIARVVLKQIGVPAELRDDLRHAEEAIARVKLREDNEMAGRSLAELALPSETGMWVTAIRRDVDYLHGPDGDTHLQTGDVLFLQGPPDGIDHVRRLAGGEPYNLAAPKPSGRLSNLDRAVDILVEMKNVTEVAVGMAYSSVLYRDLGLAREVSALEDRCDDLYHDLQHWVLRAAREVDDADVDELRGLLQIGASSEDIADAAQEMTRLAEAEEAPHPVIAAALQETDEIVSDAWIVEGSAVHGRTLREAAIETSTGMHVLAIQRHGRWIYRPRARQQLADRDRLLVTGPEEGVEQLRAMTGDDRPATPEDPDS